MEQPDKAAPSEPSHPENRQPDAARKRRALSVATLRVLAAVGAVLAYANFELHGRGLAGMPQRGWPFTVYSNFYGWESYDWPNLFANLGTAVLMLVATAWIVENCARRRFRFTLPALFGLTIVTGLLAVGAYFGIISFSQWKAPGEDCEAARCFNAVSNGLLGTTLDFRIYGDYWWEYIPFSVLLLGIGCILYAAGKVLLLPFKILTPGPFRWR